MAGEVEADREDADYLAEEGTSQGAFGVAMKLLLIPGSLRAGSSNHRALETLALVAPSSWTVLRALALDSLPFFNPDVEEAGPPPVPAAWRAEFAWADVVIISSPEYAHGIPGVLKNALDWLVGGMEVVGKPIALLNATPPATFAGAQLREVLRTMGGVIVEHASVDVSLRGDARPAAELANDPVIVSRLRSALDALERHARDGDENFLTAAPVG